MSSDVTRCPFCQALIGASWSKAHAPHCPDRPAQHEESDDPH
jgi:hypothetical protein